MPELIDAYKKGNLILFVGAGVSMNIGLPSWNALISEIANHLGYSPEVFSTYGDNLALAEYYKIKKRNIGKLRSWMDVEWHKNMNTKDSAIFSAIAEGNFPIIYTTNYDRSLEQAHDERNVPYNKIVGVEDIVQIDASKRQIVKYHGDFQNDDSLVLAESDYYARLQFETPLDIKLRSDVLGKSVLFIGYSLRDINIRILFYKLTKMWELHGYKDNRPKSYLFSPKPNPVQHDILHNWGIEMIDSEIDDHTEALNAFLNKLTKSST